MKRFISILFFFCSIYFPLFIFSEGLPLSNTDGGAQTIVNRCVSVITGDYLESSCDLVVKGPEPLVFQRYYNSKDETMEGLYGGWRHNHESQIKAFVPPETNQYKAFYTSKEGRTATYFGSYPLSKNEILRYQKDENKGFTNFNRGVLSGRTHIKNSSIKGIKNTRTLIVQAENGSKLDFSESHYNSETEISTYSLQKEKKCTGHHIFYGYKADRLKNIKVMDINANVLFSEVSINCLSKAELDQKLEFDVVASDGRKIVYKLKKFPKDKNNNTPSRYRIKEVIRPSAPYEKYEYGNGSSATHLKITKKKMPDGRFLAIEYHGAEKENSYGRVKRLLAPVGFDATPFMTHEFTYSKKCDKRGKLIEAVTYVLNAKRHLTAYWHGEDQRIEKIMKFRGTGDHKIYSTEQFYWSDEGNLLCHTLKDKHQRILAAKTFTYDSKGNVIKDSFFGTLRSHETIVSFDEKKKQPIKDHCDRFTMQYRYSQDGRNLLLEEIWPNGKTVQFSYKTNRDLVSSKLTLEHGVVHFREFYDYDDLGLVITYIKDDGTSLDKNDLSGVTERKITRTNNRRQIPFGLPEHIEDYYLDIATGNQILFKKVLNQYSITGELTFQELYDANNHLRYVQKFEYDAHGNLISEENPLGQITSKYHNRNDELIFEKELDKGFYKEYSHDFSGRLITEKIAHDDGTVLAISNIYDHLNQLVVKIDPFGQKTEYEYDELGRQVKIQYPTYIDFLGNQIKSSVLQEYDLFGNVRKKIDQLGRETVTQYNTRGQPTKITFPGGAVETFEYHSDGRLRKSVAKNGAVTNYINDCFGRILSKEIYSRTGEFLEKTSSTYNSFHKLTDTDAKGVTTYYSYTISGLLKSVQKGDSLTEYGYDEFQRQNQIKQWISKNSYVLKTQKFDLLGRVIEELTEDENQNCLSKEEYLYDKAGNKCEVIQERADGLAITKTWYDSQNRPIKVSDPMGRVTLFYYQHIYHNGQKVLEITMQDALGIQTITRSNIFGKPECIIKRNSFGVLLAKKEIAYDALLNISFTKESVISKGVETKEILTKWEYNEQNCLTCLTEAVGTAEQKVTEMCYNSFAEKIKTIKPDGTILGHEYDDVGRLKALKADDNSFSYRFSYDENGNLTQVIDLVNDQTTERFYDLADRMIKEKIGTGFEICYTYDFIGRPKEVTLPDQSFIKYDYDALHLKKVTRFSSDQKEQYCHTYNAYDLAGNLLDEQKPFNCGHVDYQYDLNSCLTKISSPHFSEEISYDEAKNLTSYEITQASKNLIAEFTYDDLYQLKSEKGLKHHDYLHDSLYNCIEKDGEEQIVNSLNQIIKSLDQTFQYDKNGNRISDDQKTYRYDALDRLTSVSFDGYDYLYTYDSFNRRLSKKVVKNEEEISKTDFLYFSQNEVGSYDENGNLNEFRLLGTGKGAEIGATVAIERKDSIYVPMHDHNGNIVSLIDKEGNAKESYRFLAFGEEFIFDENGDALEKSKTGNPWRFSSKRVDEETGFINFGRRFYDCKTAKWMSPDPIGFEGGPNLYAYVNNNPLTHFDLYGLEDLGDSAGNWGSSFMTENRRDSSYSRDRYESNLDKPKITHNYKYDIGSKNHSQNIKLSDYNKTILPVSVHHFINGILNSLEDAMMSAKLLSEIAGGVDIALTYNASHGFITDLLRARSELYDFAITESVRELQAQWTSYFENASEKAHLLQTCHSEGAIIVRNALMGFPKELCERIHVLAIAPGAYIDKGLCGSVKHYASSRDIVPLLDWRGRAACRDTTVILKPHKDAQLHDHNFASPTYQRAIQKEVSAFNKKYGDIK